MKKEHRTYQKMDAFHTFGNATKQRHLNLVELLTIDGRQNLLDFIQKQYFLSRTGVWPDAQQTVDNRFGEIGVGAQKVYHTNGQVFAVHRIALGLVQWQQNFDQKLSVFRP